MILYLSLLLLLFTAVNVEAAVTITNFNSGLQITRFDTNGDAIDAHDGEIKQFGSTFYLYGTAYACGFLWRVSGSTFCGFRVYTSTDLKNWTPAGYLFDGTTGAWQTKCAGTSTNGGCFRPHVIYNALNNNYVLWINAQADLGNAPSSYRAFTSTSPTGPFTEITPPALTITGGTQENGDFSLFVDDSGTAYIAYTNVNAGATLFELYIQQLNTSFTSGVGTAVSVATGGQYEAPAMFRRGATYYLVYDALCAYCTGASTLYRTASTPTGPWSSGTTLNSNSCGGQVAFVSKFNIAGVDTYMFGSDLWFGRTGGGATGYHNQGAANFFWIPLSFTSTSINAITCDDTFVANLTASPPLADPSIDVTSGNDNFYRECVDGPGGIVGNVNRRMQTFVSGFTGVLNSIYFTSYKYPVGTACEPTSGAGAVCTQPDQPLIIDLVTVTGTTTLTVTSTLATTSIPVASVPWGTPKRIVANMGVPVTSGSTYGIVAHSIATVGCYGWARNFNNVYPAGKAAYSTDGVSFTLEANTTYKFYDTTFARGLSGGGSITGKGSMQ